MLFRILILGLIPLLVSAIYVLAWPRVTFRPLLVGTLGALSGLSGSLVALVWTVYPALTVMTISGGNRPGQTLAQVSSGRAHWAYLFAVLFSALGVWGISKMFTSSPI